MLLAFSLHDETVGLVVEDVEDVEPFFLLVNCFSGERKKLEKRTKGRETRV